MNPKNLGPDGKENSSSLGYLPPTLARQSSVYSLTIDEFQNSLGWRGKDFGSMNMDELLKNIWNAEENPAVPTPISTSSSNLQRQGSLTLPERISQKTVDEVWKDVFKDEAAFQTSSAPQIPPKQRQPTFGEITLEEFLQKAGVVWEEPAESRSIININPSNTTPESNVFFGNASTSGFEGNNGLALGFPSSSNQVGNTPTMNAVGGISHYASRGQLGIRSGAIMGTSDPTAGGGLILGLADLGSNGGRSEVDSPRSNILSDEFGKGDGNLSPSSSPIERGLRRKGNGIVEKVVERRQRRMIKNRESAARSRARKQAYTLELEAEIAKLKELNEELMRKQAEILEMQKNQVLEKPNHENESKKRCLRRTNSWPRVE